MSTLLCPYPASSTLTVAENWTPCSMLFIIGELLAKFSLPFLKDARNQFLVLVPFGLGVNTVHKSLTNIVSSMTLDLSFAGNPELV